MRLKVVVIVTFPGLCNKLAAESSKKQANKAYI